MAKGRAITVVIGALLVAAVASRTDESTSPDVFWHADADRDVDLGDRTNFFGKHVASERWDRLTIVDDPTGRFGRVYQAGLSPEDLEAGDDRAELVGARLGEGEAELLLGVDHTSQGSTRDVWIGWRSLFGRDVVVDEDHPNDGNYMQLKGDSDCGGPAIGLTIKSGRLTLRSERYLVATDGVAWKGPPMSELLDGSWHAFVLHVRFAKDGVGGLEVFLDGRRQLMTNGRMWIRFPTMCPRDRYVRPKFGVYSMDDGFGTGPRHWIESPRIGDSYQAVAPR